MLTNYAIYRKYATSNVVFYEKQTNPRIHTILTSKRLEIDTKPKQKTLNIEPLSDDRSNNKLVLNTPNYHYEI